MAQIREVFEAYDRQTKRLEEIRSATKALEGKREDLRRTSVANKTNRGERLEELRETIREVIKTRDVIRKQEEEVSRAAETILREREREVSSKWKEKEEETAKVLERLAEEIFSPPKGPPEVKKRKR